MEVAAALEAVVDAWVDQAEFVVMWRWCMRSLAMFDAETWLLADVGRRRQEERRAQLCGGCGVVRGGLRPLECQTGCEECVGIARSV